MARKEEDVERERGKSEELFMTVIGGPNWLLGRRSGGSSGTQESSRSCSVI